MATSYMGIKSKPPQHLETEHNKKKWMVDFLNVHRTKITWELVIPVKKFTNKMLGHIQMRMY
jgi:Uri superfamily endonuclease